MESTVRQAKVLIEIHDADGTHEIGSTMDFVIETPQQAAGFERLIAQGVIEPVSARSSRRRSE